MSVATWPSLTHSLSVVTLAKYLIGDRQAIERIVRTPSAVWLGALLVLSAGLAREYDAHDLLREPWHLAIPLGASLVTSFLLFCLLFALALWRSENRQPFWPSYRSFLALYWLTAPLAWLYAIPVERFLSSAEATRANLALLALVSLWRIVLMTRVTDVVFGTGKAAAFLIVMFFADTAALFILWLTPLPILNVMGGIQMTESEELIRDTATLVAAVGAFSWLIWLLLGTAFVSSASKLWRMDLAPSADGHVDAKLWALAACAIMGWFGVLPVTQAEQRLRHDVEIALTDHRIAEGITMMSRHVRRDFPPIWDPPPRLAYPNPHPPLINVLNVIAKEGAATWVKTIYLDKLASTFDAHGGSEVNDPAEVIALLAILNANPESSAFVSHHREFVTSLWQNEKDAALKQRLGVLLKRASEDVEER